VGKIVFRIDDSKATAKLKLLQSAIDNPQPVYATVGRVLVNRIRLCFKLGIDPWGNPWQALKFRKGQPLRDTGRLNRSIVSKVDATGVTVGTNLIYAPVHQFGATIVPKNKPRLVFPGPNGKLIFAKKVTIPERPYMPLRRGATEVALPPDWALLVIRSIKSYLQHAPDKAKA
jgi:phage virion morphogenesis protein